MRGSSESTKMDPAGGVSDPARSSHESPSEDDYGGWEALTEPAPILLPMQGRSAGLHVSEIISDICIRLGYLEPRDDPMQPEWAEFGNAFEHAHIQRLCLHSPDRYVQPGEVEKDGIFGTPDLIDCLKPYRVVEIKAPWISAKWTPGTQKFWRYEIQVKAYCEMMEVGTGELHVYHVNGRYAGGGPEYRAWRREFTKRELAENWRMLRKHGDRLRERDKGKKT